MTLMRPDYEAGEPVGDINAAIRRAIFLGRIGTIQNLGTTK